MKQIPNSRNIYRIALFQLAILLLTGCNNSNQVSQQIKSWETQEVKRSQITLNAKYSASIQGKQDVEIRPQVDGVITSVEISEGDNVHKGQTLFVIDQVPYLAALNQARANVKAAKATLATAELGYRSKQKLLDEKVISMHEFLTAQNEHLRTEAELSQAQAREMEARNNLSYTEVKSPANGVIGVLPYRQGALVSSSISDPLTTVSNNSEMYVYFSVSENLLLLLMQQFGSMDKTVKGFGDIELLLSDGSLYSQKGRVESISGVVDRNTGSVSIRCKFPNDNRVLLSGSTGNIQIPSSYKDVICIPQSATIKIQDKLLVYKVINGKATSTPIKVASDNDGSSYIVLSGLQAGDVIITDGAGLVREGMEIMVKGGDDEE